MNWKIVVIGGVVFAVVFFISTILGVPLFHAGILAPIYKAHAQFWRPGFLDPNEGNLLPRALGTGLVRGLVLAGVYDWLRAYLKGPGWLRGVKYGALLWVFGAMVILLWTVMFNLPDVLFFYWMLESLFEELLAGAALGLVAQKLAPAEKTVGAHAVA
ncbi:hypothetical protein LVJ94_33865 [Pendulispora rubella]|uniref:Uncharacterized protein n=1 Tax=Pendulispora rubella TaxID=2741070 RepID=A0ABZ2KWF6_9BACT